MAVSNSTDARSVATVLIEDARSLLGINADEEPLQAPELERGKRFLTRLFKHWEGQGIGSWVYTEDTLTLVSGTESYVFGSGGTKTYIPFEITQIRINRGGNDLEMTPFDSREDYFAMPNKTTTGYPTQWWYDRQRDSGTLYVWTAPDTTAGTLKFTYRRRIMDIDAGADDYDLPPEWEKAIVENLAEMLIGPYGVADSAEAKKVMRDAPISFALIKAWDFASGSGSVSIVPDRG